MKKAHWSKQIFLFSVIALCPVMSTRLSSCVGLAIAQAQDDAEPEIDLDALKKDLSDAKKSADTTENKNVRNVANIDAGNAAEVQQQEIQRKAILEKEAELVKALNQSGLEQNVNDDGASNVHADKVITVKGNDRVDVTLPPPAASGEVEAPAKAHQPAEHKSENKPTSVAKKENSAPVVSDAEAADIEAAIAAVDSGFKASVEPESVKTVANKPASKNSTGKEYRKDVDLLQSKLDAQQVSLNAQRKTNSALEEQTAKANSRVKELLAELEETRNRLIIAEKQVERLSNIIQQRNASAMGQSPNSAMASNASRPVAPVPQDGKMASMRMQNIPASRPVDNRPAGDMQTAIVISDKANLRSGPGKENSPFTTVSRGTRLVVESRQGDWYRVYGPDGNRAWVSAEVLEFVPAGVDPSSHSNLRVKPYDPNM